MGSKNINQTIIFKTHHVLFPYILPPLGIFHLSFSARQNPGVFDQPTIWEGPLRRPPPSRWNHWNFPPNIGPLRNLGVRLWYRASYPKDLHARNKGAIVWLQMLRCFWMFTFFFTGDGADGVAATTKCSSTGGSNEPEVARINRENCGCLVKILSWHHCWKSKVPFPFSHCQGLLRGRTTIETSRCKRVSLRRTLSLDICRGSCRGPSVVWQGNSHEEIVKH